MSRLAVLLLLLGCVHMPPDFYVRGVLTEVTHDDRYEAPCTITIRIRDRALCDVPPICCSYQATVRDSTGHTQDFWAFWPKFVPGLQGLVPVGGTATFHLHRHTLILPQTCSPYGCQTQIEYALDDDSDVRP